MRRGQHPVLTPTPLERHGDRYYDQAGEKQGNQRGGFRDRVGHRETDPVRRYLLHVEG